MESRWLKSILEQEARARRAVTAASILIRALGESRWKEARGVGQAMQGKSAMILQENAARYARFSVNDREVLGFEPPELIAAFRAWREKEPARVRETASLPDQMVLWLTRRPASEAVLALDSDLRDLVGQLAAAGCDSIYFSSYFDEGAVAGLGVGKLLRGPADQVLLGREEEMARHLPLLRRALQVRQRYLLSGKPGCGKSVFLRHLILRSGTDHAFLLLTPADFAHDRAACTAALGRLAEACQDDPKLVLVWDDFDRFVRHPFLHELLLESFWTHFRGALHPVVICGVHEEMSGSPLVEKLRPAELPPLPAEATITLVGQRLAGTMKPDAPPAEAAEMAAYLVTLCQEHYHGQALPGAALALLEGALLIARARPAPWELAEEDIRTFVATDLGLSPEVFGKDKRVFYRQLRDRLEGEVFGQGHVVRAICEQLYRRALAPHAELPRGRFLFIGPPGTGKTQMAKSLARHLGYGDYAFYMFSMAEYSSDGARTRFIGSDPGYVGFKGTFTVFDAVGKTPACVVLLDEIDRAHPTIQDVLLAMLEGSARDGSGQLHRFAQVVFVMTTNLCQEIVENGFKGLPGGQTATDAERAALGSKLAAADLRGALLERRSPRKGEIDLQPMLVERRRELEAQLHGLLGARPTPTEPGTDRQENRVNAILSSLHLVASTLAQLDHLSGRNALDRAFLDRVDFLFPFLPLEPRHLRFILEKHIRAEKIDPATVDTQAILQAAAAESEAGRAVYRHWAEFRGRSLSTDLWEF